MARSSVVALALRTLLHTGHPRLEALERGAVLRRPLIRRVGLHDPIGDRLRVDQVPELHPARQHAQLELLEDVDPLCERRELGIGTVAAERRDDLFGLLGREAPFLARLLLAAMEGVAHEVADSATVDLQSRRELLGAVRRAGIELARPRRAPERLAHVVKDGPLIRRHVLRVVTEHQQGAHGQAGRRPAQRLAADRFEEPAHAGAHVLVCPGRAQRRSRAPRLLRNPIQERAVDAEVDEVLPGIPHRRAQQLLPLCSVALERVAGARHPLRDAELVVVLVLVELLERVHPTRPVDELLPPWIALVAPDARQRRLVEVQRPPELLVHERPDLLDLPVIVLGWIDARRARERLQQRRAVPSAHHGAELVREEQVEQGVGLHGIGGRVLGGDDLAERPRMPEQGGALVLVALLDAREQPDDEAHERVAPVLAHAVRRRAAGVQRGAQLRRQRQRAGKKRKNGLDVFDLLRAARVCLAEKLHEQQLGAQLDRVRLHAVELLDELAGERPPGVVLHTHRRLQRLRVLKRRHGSPRSEQRVVAQQTPLRERLRRVVDLGSAPRHPRHTTVIPQTPNSRSRAPATCGNGGRVLARRGSRQRPRTRRRLPVGCRMMSPNGIGEEETQRFARALLMPGEGFDAWLPDAEIAERFVAPLTTSASAAASAPAVARSGRGRWPARPGSQGARTWHRHLSRGDPNPSGGAVTRRMTRCLALTLALVASFVIVAATASAAGSRAGGTRAAKRHAIAYVKRYGIILRTTRPRPAVLDGGAVALEVLRLRQRRPVHGHPDRGVLDTRTDLPGAEHRHRLRRMMSR